MFKQLVLSLGLIAAAQASFIFVLSERIVEFNGIPLTIYTKGFLAYEGGATEWSASSNSHPGLSGTLTTKFSGITVNNGGVTGNHHDRMGITVYGNYWGEYDLTEISSGGTSYYAVCHSDSNTNYCGPDNWKYMTDFAMAHI